jgi:hypothetical protein
MGLGGYTNRIGNGDPRCILDKHVTIHRLTLLNHNLSKLLRLQRNTSSCLVDSDFVNPSTTWSSEDINLMSNNL